MSWESYWKTCAVMVKMSRDSKAKMDFTESKTIFFCLFQKQLLPGDIPIMDQNLVLLWNMGKLLDNLQL